MARETHARSGRLVLFLLLANLLLGGVFLAIEQWLPKSPRLPEFNADKVKLLRQPELPRKAAATEPSQAVLPEALCYKISSADPLRFQALLTQLDKLGVPGGKVQIQADASLPWWVYWPPEYEAGQREVVQKKFAQAGVKDLLPITRGPMAQSYSLGMFPTGLQARAHRDVLRQKGLEKAEYGPRTTLGTFRLQLMPDTVAQRQEMVTVLPDWLEILEPSACAVPGG